MSDYVETMAYNKRETPWHGLGVPVEDNISTDEMLKAAGLDWTVSKRQLYFPKLVLPGERPQLKIVPDEFAIVRDDSESVLDTAGSNWKPVQNHEIMDFFKRFVEAGDMRMETAGSLKDGKFIFALAKLDESFKLGNEDAIENYILLSQPHQFGFSMTAAATPIRVVCWNTITYALGANLDGRNLNSNGKTTASFRMPHSQAFNDEVKAAAESALGLASSRFKAFSHTAELLSNRAAKHDEVLDYFYDVVRVENPEAADESDEETKNRLILSEVLDETRAEEEIKNRTVRRFDEALLQAPGQQLDSAKGTWWGAVNAVTYCVDHELGRNQDNRLTNAWFGPRSAMKRRAVDLALERVELLNEAA